MGNTNSGPKPKLSSSLPQKSPSVPIATPPKNLQRRVTDAFVGSPLQSVDCKSFVGFESSNLQTIPTIINWKGKANQVYVLSSSNNWRKKIPLVKSTEDFTAVLDLPPGTHQLKFVVDDEVQTNSELPSAADASGNIVNYVQVGIEEALASPANESPPGDYGRRIPILLGERRPSGQKNNNPDRPPALPPHLGDVILNSKSGSGDSCILPVPHQVCLNHLYACSTKEGVISVAATCRYRQKYITTVYYTHVSQ